jgi:uncharacterized protein GlcG (DUF336 family)
LSKLLVGALALALLPIGAVAAPVQFERSIPLDLAHEAANAALAACRAKGAHPTVGIMDAFGQVKLLMVDDTATLLSQKAVVKTMFLALMLPASTLAVSTRNEVADAREIGPSAGVFERIAPGKALVQPGAIPITIDKEVIGVIGVNGSPTGVMDDECAKAGIAKIQDRLK